jgi:hypothetical protein
MTPVDQEFLHDPPKQNGDCLRAVTTSLLDLPISEVPHFFEDPNDWFVRWTLWLQGRGLCVVPLCGQLDIAAFHVAIGLSRRGNPHSVVMHTGQVVHDPHPTRDALASVEGAFVLLPIEEVTSKVYPLSGDLGLSADRDHNTGRGV